MNKTLNIVVVLAILNIALLGIFFYEYGDLQTQKKAEAKLRQNIADQDGLTNQMFSLRHTALLAQVDRAELEQNLFDPTDENQIDFISQIEHLGVVSGTKISVDSIGLASSPRLLHAEVSISGTWGGVFYALKLIEGYPDRMIVRGMNIGRSGAVSKAGDVWGAHVSVDLVNVKQ